MKKTTANKRTAKTTTKPKAATSDSRKDQIITLISTKAGATLLEIMKATGLQAHSVRGFISGTLGSKMGLHVESFRNDAKERCYRLQK